MEMGVFSPIPEKEVKEEAQKELKGNVILYDGRNLVEPKYTKTRDRFKKNSKIDSNSI